MSDPEKREKETHIYIHIMNIYLYMLTLRTQHLALIRVGMFLIVIITD